MFLLKTFDTNAYYEKINIVSVGLFSTKEKAFEYAYGTWGYTVECDGWSFSVTELKFID